MFFGRIVPPRMRHANTVRRLIGWYFEISASPRLNSYGGCEPNNLEACTRPYRHQAAITGIEQRVHLVSA
jgi:hypothetical protein